MIIQPHFIANGKQEFRSIQVDIDANNPSERCPPVPKYLRKQLEITIEQGENYCRQKKKNSLPNGAAEIRLGLVVIPGEGLAADGGEFGSPHSWDRGIALGTPPCWTVV